MSDKRVALYLRVNGRNTHGAEYARTLAYLPAAACRHPRTGDQVLGEMT